MRKTKRSRAEIEGNIRICRVKKYKLFTLASACERGSEIYQSYMKGYRVWSETQKCWENELRKLNSEN